MRGIVVSLTVATALGVVGVASAQTPVPPTDLPTPGSGTVEGEVVVTRQEQVRVPITCILGEVPCTGTVRLQTLRPVVPGKGKARRIVTIAEGSYGTMQPGERKTITLKLHRDGRARVRKFPSTAITWDTFAADGVKNFLFIRHDTTLVSRAAR
ncbi:hypothetical protein OJ998_23695 [Solirubrobacter taibaiensis]|nr:hypothetical protein [Solirubrobacter taibaiensis]